MLHASTFFLGSHGTFLNNDKCVKESDRNLRLPVGILHVLKKSLGFYGYRLANEQNFVTPFAHETQWFYSIPF